MHNEPRRLSLIPGGGGTNSRHSIENDAPSAAGVDTLRLRFRSDRDAYERFTHRREGVREAPGGERWARTDTGARIGVYPDGLVYSEARAVTYLEGVDAGGLLAAADLPLAEQAARAQLEPEVGELPALVTVGRADLASELRFRDGREGLSLLHALASVDVPWGKVGVEGKKGLDLETVNVRHVRGRSITARAYCKATETGTGPAGSWIRLERQLRFRKAREQSLGQFLASDLRRLYLGRLATFAHASDVVVTDVVGALERLGELGLPPSKRNRLAGFLLYGANREDYRGASGRPTMAYYRAVKELRDLGVAVDPAMAGRLVVPLGSYLDRLAEPWARAA